MSQVAHKCWDELSPQSYSFMPALYMVVGLEWAAVVHVPQVKIVVAHQPGILKVGDGIKRSEPKTQSLPFK